MRSEKLLEDIEAIKALQASFVYAVDDMVNFKHDIGQGLKGLLTDDVHFEMEGTPPAEGKDAVVQFLSDSESDGLYTYMSHMLSNPVIDVSGDGAKGRWYVYCVLKLASRTNPAYSWFHGSYDNTYKKIDGRWKIHGFRAHGLHEPI